MKTFYETLTILMDEKGMTAADICAKADLHQSYLSKLKSGHVKDPTWDKALAIVEALGITPNDFLAIQFGD